VLKYWLVAKKVTMINSKTEDKLLQHKVRAIFIFVTMCVLVLTITYFAIFYSFDPQAAGVDDLTNDFKIMAGCATIPSVLTISLLIQAIYLLKNNSGEDSLSKSKVCILCAASLLCMCTYIFWSAAFGSLELNTRTFVLTVFLFVFCSIWSGIFLWILWDIG
jgi:hypothetical protein